MKPYQNTNKKIGITTLKQYLNHIKTHIESPLSLPLLGEPCIKNLSGSLEGMNSEFRIATKWP